MIKLGKEVIPIIKTEERESSEMCEFIISGNESYVLNCLKLILTKQYIVKLAVGEAILD